VFIQYADDGCLYLPVADNAQSLSGVEGNWHRNERLGFLRQLPAALDQMEDTKDVEGHNKKSENARKRWESFDVSTYDVKLMSIT